MSTLTTSQAFTRAFGLLLDQLLAATPAWNDLLARVDHVALTLQSNQEVLMATMAELQASIAALSAGITDYTGDVTTALQALLDQQSAMRTTLEAALANDTVDQATIADLQAQLAAMNEGTTTARAAIDALAAAVAAADVAVDQPPPPAP